MAKTISAKNKVLNTKIGDLIPDDMNANKGTEYGQHLVENSLRQFGAGRSILLDKHNRIIAGNKTVENAGAIGIEEVLIVETTGNQIVAVKRTDIDLNSKEGREMALADNAAAKANICWDEENIELLTEQWDIEPEEWGLPQTSPDDEEGEEAGAGEERQKGASRLIVECADLPKLTLLFTELKERGFTCEIKE